MKKILYDNEFKDVFKYCEKEHLYLGVGNPNANILIIGKENTPERGKDEESENNLNSWKDIIDNNRQIPDINFLENNSLFPWKGQKFWLGKYDKNKNLDKHGTATTWYFYQVLIDLIRAGAFKNENDELDFHEYCFQSEMSQINSKSSTSLPKEEEHLRVKSIKERQKLFTHPFFNRFEIIILACGHYPKEYNFNIENTFNVKWHEPTIELSKGNWYNIHYDTNNEKSRLVIHTRQFSNGISTDLIVEIANKCRDFINNDSQN